MKTKLEFKRSKYLYLFLITIVILGFISGIIFSNILSYNDYKVISDVVINYFTKLSNNQDINFTNNLFNSITINYIYMILIWIFGLSIIGIILNPFILYFKSLVIGFSTGIIISIYGIKGVVLALFYVFPNQIINLLVYTLLSFYGLNLSIKLFKYLFIKKQFNFNEIIRKYLKILSISCLILLISSLYETFLGDFVMKVFTFLIK